MAAKKSKSGSSRSQGRGKSGVSATIRGYEGYLAREWNYKKIIENPAFRYVAGAVATAVVTRLVTNMSGRYPMISGFLRENLDFIEDKLTEFKNELTGEDNLESNVSH